MSTTPSHTDATLLAPLFVVLDLDETLFCAITFDVNAPPPALRDVPQASWCDMSCAAFDGDRPHMHAVFHHDGHDVGLLVHFRPFVRVLWQFLSDQVRAGVMRVGIFTASVEPYARAVLDVMTSWVCDAHGDGTPPLVHDVWTRDHVVRDVGKDMRLVAAACHWHGAPYPLSRIVHVDNTPETFLMSPEQALWMPSYMARQDERYEGELLYLIMILAALARDADVRDRLRQWMWVVRQSRTHDRHTLHTLCALIECGVGGWVA